jgi:hypothetical protein
VKELASACVYGKVSQLRCSNNLLAFPQRVGLMIPITNRQFDNIKDSGKGSSIQGRLDSERHCTTYSVREMVGVSQ